MKTNRKAILFVLHSIIPLTLGGLLYITMRPKNLRMFSWFQNLNLNHYIDNMRQSVRIYSDIPEWIYYSLPDGLWVYALSSGLLLIWNNNLVTNYLLLIPFIFGILIEVLQLFNLFPGTYDDKDILLSILGLALSKILLTQNFKNHEKKLF